VLRPRRGWEALDLGFQMAREWWRPIWAVWFSVYLPVAALCLLVFSNKFHTVLVLWWLKPLFDRAVLHSASRAVFGEPQGALATLRAMREWLPPGIVTALTLSRLNLARSFALPVAQLERQRGKDARMRHAALGSRQFVVRADDPTLPLHVTGCERLLHRMRFQQQAQGREFLEVFSRNRRYLKTASALRNHETVRRQSAQDLSQRADADPVIFLERFKTQLVTRTQLAEDDVGANASIAIIANRLTIFRPVEHIVLQGASTQSSTDATGRNSQVLTIIRQ
jgi:hypothetical protein